MKRKHLLYLVACAILFSSTACSNDDLIEETELVSESLVKHPHRIMANLNPKDYNVSIDMVNGYLRLTKKINELRSITPLTIEQDTLAWAVQYQKGWQVLSGDSRMAPVLISCEDGDFELKVPSPNTYVVDGLLHHIRDIHYGTDTIKDRLWIFLETSKLSAAPKRGPRRIGGEIATRGMWVELETNYESSSRTIPHIIQASWGQGADNFEWDYYNGPYFFSHFNSFTKKIQGKHTKVGCTAVTAGQIIHHFRKTNHRNIPIPTNGEVIGNNTVPNFYDDTTAAWVLMENVLPDPPTSYYGVKHAALFLSFLGNQMGLDYGLNYTTGDIDDAKAALTDYKLAYDQINSYNFSAIDNSLNNNMPVYVSAKNKKLSNTEHSFIIDSKFEIEERVITTYLWDNDYEVSWEEYNRLDPWRFEMPDEYDPYEDNDVYYEYLANHSKSISLAMNWGWHGTCNSNYYLAYHYIAPFSDEYGYYPGVNCVCEPNWRVIINNDTIYYDQIHNILYNIRERIDL